MPTTTRGREYDPEAERYLCCGSRVCWWCERGTVRVNDGHNEILLGELGIKMMNQSWWEPSISAEYLIYLVNVVIKALAVLEAQGKTRLPLRLTGERFDSTDANRLRDLAGLPFTKEDQKELFLISFLERQRSESRPYSPGAFPTPEDHTYEGMTLRDYFAAAALTGIMVDTVRNVDLAGGVAEDAYAFADAMLAERDKP